MAEIGRKVTAGFLSNLLNAPIGLVGLYLITQNTSPASLGMFSFGLGTYTLVAFLNNLGLHGAFVRTMARQEHAQADVVTTYKRWRNGLLLGTLTLSIVATFVWDAVFGFTDATTLPVMLIALTYVTLESMKQLQASILQVHLLTATQQVTSNIDTVARTLLLAGFVLFLERPSTEVEGWGILIGFAYLLGSAVAYVYQVLRARPFWPRTGSFVPTISRELWSIALPLALAGVIVTLNTSLDRVMIGYFWSATQVGHYFTAQRVAFAVQIVPGLLAGLLLPMMSKQVADADLQGMRTLFTKSMKYLLIVMGPLSLGFVAFSDQILLLLGNAYADASTMLRWFGPLLLVQSIAIIQGTVLGALGRVRQAAIAATLMASANLILNAFLIPTSILFVPGLGLGATGAVIATFLAMTIQVAVQSLFLRLDLQGGLWNVRTLLPVAAAAVAVWLFLQEPTLAVFGETDRFWEIGVAYAGYAGLSMALMMIVGSLGRTEFQLIWASVHPGELAKYLRKELGGKP